MLAGLLEMAQVEVFPAMEDRWLRHVGERLAIAIGAGHGMAVQVELLLLDLFLKQRMEHDRRCPGPLQGLQLVQLLAEGRGSAHHQGAAQGQAEIGGGEVGDHGLGAGWARAR